MMDTEKKNDFLLLLKVADYAHMGKSRAILTAFKLGYLQGKTAHEPGIHDLGFQNMLSGVALKLEKSINCAADNHRRECIRPDRTYKG